MAAWLRLAVLSALLVIGVPPIALTQVILMRLGLPGARWMPVIFHRYVCRVLNVRVNVVGARAEERPLILLANHCSWLDIPVIGTLGPQSFIAKREVRDWPALGFLATLQRTIFIDRDRRSQTGKDTQEIASRLTGGDPVVLFGEGTSSDGNRTLPFKSALVGAAESVAGEKDDVWLQPVAIAYTHVNGMPMGRQHRPIAAWYGDDDLVPHLTGVLKAGPIDVDLVLGTPIHVGRAGGRKKATRLVEARVREMLGAALTGRRQDEAVETLSETMESKAA